MENTVTARQYKHLKPGNFFLLFFPLQISGLRATLWVLTELKPEIYI